MSGVATAIAGAAVIGAVVSSNNASKASNATQNAANLASATQQNQFNQTRQDQLPSMNRGNAAGNQLAYLMGLPGYGPPPGAYQQPANGGAYAPAPGTWSPTKPPNDGAYIPAPGSWSLPIEYQDPGGVPSAFGMVSQKSADEPGSVFTGGTLSAPPASTGTHGGGSVGWGTGSPQQAQGAYNTQMGAYGSLSTPFSQTNWQADPGYAFRLAEGQKALERSGSAKGLTLSGAQQKALLAYGQGMGAQEYGAAYGRYNNDQSTLFNRLSGIAGTGQQANQFVGQLGSNMANQVSGNMMNAGAGQAAGYLAQGNAWTGALNNGMNQWQNYNAWNSMNGAAPYSYTGTPGSSSNFGNNWGQPVPYATRG